MTGTDRCGLLKNNEPMIRIRQEEQTDRAAVFDVVRRAFEHAGHTDHDEHHLVERLRESDAFVPELSLVAVDAGEVVGHVLFTRVRIGDTVQLALAPVSVRPDRQRGGIGSLLIIEGHRIARRLGYGFVVVLGHEAYYPRFGYRPASGFGIRAPFDVPDANFMAVDLQERNIRLDAAVEYAGEFFNR